MRAEGGVIVPKMGRWTADRGLDGRMDGAGTGGAAMDGFLIGVGGGLGRRRMERMAQAAAGTGCGARSGGNAWDSNERRLKR